MSGNLCYCKNREGKIAKRKVIQWIAAVAIMLVGKLFINTFYQSKKKVPLDNLLKTIGSLVNDIDKFYETKA